MVSQSWPFISLLFFKRLRLKSLNVIERCPVPVSLLRQTSSSWGSPIRNTFAESHPQLEGEASKHPLALWFLWMSVIHVSTSCQKGASGNKIRYLAQGFTCMAFWQDRLCYDYRKSEKAGLPPKEKNLCFFSICEGMVTREELWVEYGGKNHSTKQM